MIYEEINTRLKTHLRLAENLIHELNTLKSANTKNSEQEFETIYANANKLLKNTEGLGSDLKHFIKALIKEIPHSQQLKTPEGILYSTPLENFNFSNRTLNALKNLDVFTIGDLAAMPDLESFRKARGIGLIAINEVENFMIRTGIK